MNIWNRLQEMLQFIWDGVSRIFGPSDDEYPNSGVQPFEGDAFDSRRDNS